MKFKELPPRSTACSQINQIRYMVNVPNSITYLNWTPIFDWCVVRCESKNRHQKDMCSKGIGLRSKFKGLIISLIGGGLLGPFIAPAILTLKKP